METRKECQATRESSTKAEGKTEHVTRPLYILSLAWPSDKECKVKSGTCWSGGGHHLDHRGRVWADDAGVDAVSRGCRLCEDRRWTLQRSLRRCRRSALSMPDLGSVA